MRRSSRFPLVVLAALLMAPAGLATGCEPTTSSPEADINVPGSTRIYLDIDIGPFDPISIWVYEEANGIDGLQRDDEIHDDTCEGEIEGDRISF